MAMQTNTDPRPPKKSNRKPRKGLTLPPGLHQLFKTYARRHGRLIGFELKVAVIEHLRKNGVEVPDHYLEE